MSQRPRPTPQIAAFIEGRNDHQRGVLLGLPAIALHVGVVQRVILYETASGTLPAGRLPNGQWVSAPVLLAHWRDGTKPAPRPEAYSFLDILADDGVRH